MTEPLYLDERLEERERARVGHIVARWLKKLIPSLAYCGPPRTRPSVATQLGRRSSFSADAWRGYGTEQDIAEILETIQKELALPNHNFIPDDPLVLLMGSGYDRDDAYAVLELERKFAVKYTGEELERIRNADWTLGKFVKDLLTRTSKPGRS